MRRAIAFDINKAELAARIMEAFMEEPRPDGMSGEEAIMLLDQQTRDWALKAAQDVCDYFQECSSRAFKVDAQ